MSITARVFMSGRSQALRLPAKLRLQAKTVRIEQIGNDLWLHPETPPEQDMGVWLQQFYANSEALPADFLGERIDLPPQERDWA
ncbi:MAG TPA: AbrB family transcriptional regulator [Anaerolineae bacterium]|nr:AbrB family transcriptional regulator [Anaerolineae bacterium]